jgi:outer membrane protein assembly factor BamB
MLFAGSPAAGTPEWGSFRGPSGSGIAPSALPGKLDPAVNLLWRRELETGYSSPVVAGEAVFLTAASPKDERLLVLCLERETGALSWRAEIEYDGSSRIGQNSPAAPTPATDGETVVALFHHVGLLAYDLDGRELWRNPLGAPYDIPHGISASPLLHRGKVVVQIDQDDGAKLVCVDAASGKLLWEVPREVTHGYSTPAVLDSGSTPAQVIANGARRIVSYDLGTGATRWWVDGAAWQAKAAPVLHGDLCLVNAFMVPTSEFGGPPSLPSFDEALAEHDADQSGTIGKAEWDLPVLQMAWAIFDLNEDQELDHRDYDYLQSAGSAVGGLFAVRTDGEGDVTRSHVQWLYDERRGLSDVIMPVVVGETLFQLRDGGILTAIEVGTGKVLKHERVGEPDEYFASPVAAGGRLLLASKSGQLSVVDASAEFAALSTTDLGEEIWSVPAIAGERVLVRSQKALYCFSTAEPAAAAEAAAEDPSEG